MEAQLKTWDRLELDPCGADAPSLCQPCLGYTFPAEKL
jgi:hypothetical protein